MKKLFNVMLIAVVIAAFVVPGFAEQKCCDKHKAMGVHEHGKDGKCCDMARLKLTEKQQAEFDKMHKGCTADKTKIHEKIAKLQEEKSKLMAADKPDRAAIDKVIEAIGNLTTEGKKVMAGCQLSVKALLTPDQLKTWEKMHTDCGHACCGHKEAKAPEVKKVEKHVTDCSATCPSHSATCAEKHKKG